MEINKSSNLSRRSSFDKLEFEPIQRNKNKKYKYMNLLIILINIIMILFGIIFIILVSKTDCKEIIDLKHLTEDNNVEEIHIDKNYDRIEPNDSNYIYIPIIATNDIHGNFFPVINEFTLNNKTIKYKTGGLEFISKYINILKEEFGKDRILYLDSGDNYFESYSAKYFDGEIIQDFFHLIGLNGTTLGNHEFLLRKKWIEKKIKNAKYPILINNYQEIKTKNKNGILGENQKKSYLYDIKLDNGDIIKIGVIGLALNLDIDKKFYNVGRKYTWNDFAFQDYNIDLENEAQKLRSEGANAIIILSHIGLNCTNHDETEKLNMYNKKIQQSECQYNSPILKLINSTKPGLIDAIINGDMHNEVHHWIKSIPVMCTKGRSKTLNIMYMPFKKDKNKKYVLVNEEIKIEGPVPSCEKIFSNTKSCDKIPKNQFYDPGKLLNYYWRAHKIEKDPIVEPLYKKYYPEYKKNKEEEMFKFVGFDKEIKVNQGDSVIEQLFLDVIKNLTKTDFSIVHRRMFTFPAKPGKVTFDEFMKIIPYSGEICTTEVTGKELINIIKIVQMGHFAFQPTSGLKQTIKIDDYGNKKEVLNVEIYENGIAVPIDLDKIYKMSSNSIVLSDESYDEFTNEEVVKIINNKLNKNKVLCQETELNLVLLDYFHKKKIVDVNKEVDMSKPRIILVK